MIRVLAGAADLAAAVAELFVFEAAKAIDARGRFLAALSGGSTPRDAYRVLATPELAKRVDWARVHLFWSDERAVSPDDPQSNYRMANEALIERIAPPRPLVYRIRGEDDPLHAAAQYERELENVQRGDGLDLVLLGLGADGHTASLFPGHEAVRETARSVVAEYVGTIGRWRITMTPALIARSRVVAVVVSGRDKAETVARALETARRADPMPIQVVTGRPGVVWLLDRDAARTYRNA